MRSDISQYDHKQVESYWQKRWEQEGLNRTGILTSPKPYYNLMMYPYPSAEGLHVGHVFAFGGADIHGRLKRMQGFDVFEPIGFDSGGIHSENFAIKMGKHPRVMTQSNIANFTRQLKRMGNMYDWDHTVDAMDPGYYKWTQWVFTRMFKAGLAYKKPSAVTWCPNCKTTVSDEQTEKIMVRKEVEKGSIGNEDLRPSDKIGRGELHSPSVMEEITVCERCKTPIERRFMNQWFFRITEYANRLLENTNTLDWPDKILATQRNWIGKSDGATVKFSILPPEADQPVADKFQFSNKKEENPSFTKEGTLSAAKAGRFDTDVVSNTQNIPKSDSIEVFTTRPDTLHGCTYLVLAPEHPLVLKITGDSYKDKVQDYIEKSKAKTEQERKIGDKAKTGVFTGAYAVNPVNGKQVPIWVADYVLMDYGEGAIMAVPAHDGRDFEFARTYGLKIIPVVQPPEEASSSSDHGNNNYKDKPYDGPGTLINSGDWNGWKYPEDASRVISWLEQKGAGEAKTTYKLRDWNISRQRYWGPPIPMIYCEACAKEGRSWFTENKEAALNLSRNSYSEKKTQDFDIVKDDVSGWFPVPDDELPVLLPDIDDYLPDGSGKAPLARHPEFFETTCPHCGNKAVRETDVSDTFLDSAWYFLRYPSTGGGDVDSQIANTVPFDPAITKKWLPVSQYCGGAEHSVLHLMYSRFVTMVLHDTGWLDFEEPFPHFYAHGLIIKDGAKMSKSRGNVIDPDEYMDRYGTDCMRLYMSFMGPYSDGGDFRDTGIAGMQRFVRRIWTNFQTWKGMEVGDEQGYVSLERTMHRSIQKVTQSITQFKYNTAIAALMEYMNGLEAAAPRFTGSNATSTKLNGLIKTYLLLLAPFAPHIAEELWQLYSESASTGHQSVHRQAWPGYDEGKLQADQVTIAVQVNGKLRGTLQVPVSQSTDKPSVLEAVHNLKEIGKHLEGKQIHKEIFVPGKLVNLVVG